MWLLAVFKIKKRVVGNAFRVGRNRKNKIDRRIERIARKGFPTLFRPMENTDGADVSNADGSR